MAKRKASVWKYVRIGKAWRCCRPVIGANHKIKPHWVYTNSHEGHHPEGNYYIQFTVPLEMGLALYPALVSQRADHRCAFLTRKPTITNASPAISQA